MMFADILKDTIIIACFVMVIMLIIEYINVRSKGNWSNFLKKSWIVQLLFACLIGVTPGCLGSYAVVSLFTHNILNFGSLVTALTATFGDEALIMFSQRPDIAFKLACVLLVTGIITGILIKLLFKNKFELTDTMFHFAVHHGEDDTQHYGGKNIFLHFKKISFQRAILLFGIILFLFGILSGQFAEDSGVFSKGGIDWIKITSVASASIALLIVCIVPDHFLEEHLWGHIIKKHFLKIFLWTLGALLLIHFFLDSVNLQDWVKTNRLMVLLIALLIGIIPESGPHLIFFFMFVNGSIPFSILVANSVVQDGHGALPLLAESKKSFLLLKAVKLFVGFLIGISGFYLSW
ncbi:MAG: arsenic efflux protein [Bacteroidia bacterium]|nr:arsenic efflux protein [Bacteroidia bacterium]